MKERAVVPLFFSCLTIQRNNQPQAGSGGAGADFPAVALPKKTAQNTARAGLLGIDSDILLFLVFL
jgi:hypothetical protein